MPLIANLVHVAAHWGNLQHQHTAVDWLQHQLEDTKLHGDLAWRFARAYRDSNDGTAISMSKVFEFYAMLPHQNVALAMLQNELTRETMQEFTNKWRKSPPKLDHINLDVPWLHQRSDRTCFSASIAMMGAFNSAVFKDRFAAKSGKNIYERYVEALDLWGDTTDPSAHIRMLTALGISPIFRTDMSLAEMMELTLRGTAVAFGFLHRGSLNNPVGGGHWACCRGFTADRNFIYVNDPYGSLNDAYTGDINNGNNVLYSRAQMNNRFTVETPGIDSRHGWAFYI